MASEQFSTLKVRYLFVAKLTNHTNATDPATFKMSYYDEAANYALINAKVWSTFFHKTVATGIEFSKQLSFFPANLPKPR